MCGIQKMIQKWMQEEVDGFTIFMCWFISCVLYVVVLAFHSEMIVLSDPPDNKEAAAWLAIMLSLVGGVFTLLFVAEYIKRYGERLLLNVIFVSGAVASMLLFAFWRIAEAKNYYFLSPLSPIIAHLSATTILALALHCYWTAPYMLKADYDRTGIFDAVFVRG